MSTAPSTDADPVVASCSFCAKPNTDVAKLVAGPGVYICDECVALCQQVIDADARPGESRGSPRGSRLTILMPCWRTSRASPRRPSWSKRASQGGSPGPRTRSYLGTDRRGARHDPPVRVGAFLRRGLTNSSSLHEGALPLGRDQSADPRGRWDHSVRVCPGRAECGGGVQRKHPGRARPRDLVVPPRPVRTHRAVRTQSRHGRFQVAAAAARRACPVRETRVRQRGDMAPRRTACGRRRRGL